MKKHIFYCYDDKPEFLEEADCIAVVAESAKKALEYCPQMTYAEDARFDKDAESLPMGIIDEMEGLRRQIYGYIEGKCPRCNNPDEFAKLCLDEDNNDIRCDVCWEWDVKDGVIGEYVDDIWVAEEIEK